MNLPSHVKLVILDVDGTLVSTKSGETFRKTADDWQWLPGRLETLQQLKAEEIAIRFASNQGGVAFDYLKEHEIINEFMRMTREIGFEPGTNIMHICFTHPKAIVAGYLEESHGPNSNRRKPGPGMLQEAMLQENVSAQDTLMVGDRPEDEQAAQNAGAAFMWSDEFFKEEV